VTASLAELLDRSADRHADRDAVVLDGARTTWGELDAEASRIAHSFASRGVRPGDRVGLWLPKSHAAIAAIWGTLRAGAAYVPIDPGAPPARLATLARDAGIAALVVSPDRVATTDAALAGLDSLRGVWVAPARGAAAAEADATTAEAAPRIGWDEVRAAPATPPAARPGRDDLAYILYTSGSTGVPKGVAHTHASALAFAEWATATFELTADDRVSNHAPFHFDLSTFDLFSSAAAGATVYPVPARATMFPAAIAQLYVGERLTVWYETPTALALLLRHGQLATRDLSALRVLLFAGEVMPVPLLREFMALCPRARFANLYGPTETNVCTWHDVTAPPALDRPLPIGVPSCGDSAWVLDDDLREVSPGEPGELWVSGPTVMSGYWGDAERTERTLRQIPVGEGTRRAYRTGDVARWSDGVLHFQGRRDHQIKTRGYRVELGEIESALHSHPAVAQAVVAAVPDPEIGHRLRAFVVVRPPAPDAAALKEHCARTLPRYMVPELIEFRDDLPRTTSGKVDRGALAAEPALERKDPA